MSLKLNKNNLKERAKTENGISSENLEKEATEEKEQNVSKLTNMKVFNGLVKEEKDIFKSLNQKNSNKNTKNKNDLDSFFKDEKNIDLNYISFGDCDNLFVNNLTREEKTKEKTNIKDKNKKEIFIPNKKEIVDNKKNNIYENKKIQKIIVEERLLNRNNQVKNDNKSKDLFTEFIINQNKNKKPIIERKEKESRNFFKISDIKRGEALLVTNDDIIFSFPACLLPRGAKLGQTFSLEIKSFDNNYNKNELEEIDQIQNKYAKQENDINKNELEESQ